VDRSAATQLELDVDAFLDFMSELETSGSGEITGDLYMYLLDEYQAGKVRGSNAVSPRRYVTSGTTTRRFLRELILTFSEPF